MRHTMSAARSHKTSDIGATASKGRRSRRCEEQRATSGDELAIINR